MKEKKSILDPVNPADFKVDFGGKKEKHPALTPEEAFAPSIAYFKKFAAGPYFWFVADASKGITYSAGGHLSNMLPFAEKDFVNHSPEILFRHTHPEDVPSLFAFTNHWIAFFMGLPAEQKPNVHPTIYLRLQNPSKLYYWVMIQYAEHIFDSTGNILFGLTLVTDISHIKKEGPAMMSILDASEDTCHHFFCSDGQSMLQEQIALPKITPREVEVLRFLAIGYSSKQMASELNVSIKTVDNHRQNLLRKTNSKSSSELTSYGVKMGFV